MQWRQYFPNIPNYYCYHSGRGNEGILSRRSRNDLSRLENHHDIDPATPGILLELWLLDYLMKMNVLTIILLLISIEYWQLIRTKTIRGLHQTNTNTNTKPGKSVRWRWSGKTLPFFSWVNGSQWDNILYQPWCGHIRTGQDITPDTPGDWDMFSQLPVVLDCSRKVENWLWWYPSSGGDPFKTIFTVILYIYQWFTLTLHRIN